MKKKMIKQRTSPTNQTQVQRKQTKGKPYRAFDKFTKAGRSPEKNTLLYGPYLQVKITREQARETVFSSSSIFLEIGDAEEPGDHEDHNHGCE